MLEIFSHEGPVKNCALEVLTGKILGEGSSRTVYEVAFDSSLVLKLERTGKTFHNPTEFLIWEEVKDWPIADWFAPCIAIDSWGSALIQRRTKTFENEDEFRRELQRSRAGRIPSFFADTHYHNFGLLNDVVVCHDYGYNKAHSTSARAMCEELGIIKYDPPDAIVKTHRQEPLNGQLPLDL